MGAMDLRLIEIVLPRSADEAVRKLVEDAEKLEVWQEPALDGQRLVRIVVEAEDVEVLLDKLEQRFGHHDGFRVVILKVEATLPRPKAVKPPAEEESKPARKAMRVSREELLADLTPGTKLSRRYLAMIVLSAIVAAAGLLRDSVAVIIGAMVIAPLLTPNMALALATTLGEREMIRRAIRTVIVGVLLALVFSVGVGLFAEIDLRGPKAGEILARTGYEWGDEIVALAAGIAGALAFTLGAPSSLVGVMVAVALMPPLVTGGMLLGDGQWKAAGGAFILLAANLICVNLAGVGTFLVQGVRPRTWWKAEKARRRARRAAIIWAVLLATLVTLKLVA